MNPFKFLIGAAIGAGAALLLSPKSGRENRQYLAEKVDVYVNSDQPGAQQIRDAVEKVKPVAADVSSKVKETIDSVSETAKPATENVKEKINEARDKIAEQIVNGSSEAKTVQAEVEDAIESSAAQVANED